MGQLRLRSVIIASLAGLLFGFDTAVISGVTDALRNVFSLSPDALGFAVSIALWGTFLGALFFGKVGDHIGGRDALRLIGIMYIVSSLGCALSPNLPVFLTCRFVLGLAIGGSSVLAPVYISEIVSAERRGALVGLFQFNIVFGILLAYLSNFLVGVVIAGPDVWRWKLGLASLPALAFLGLLYGIPQSARWLVANGRTVEALASLGKLGVADPAKTVSTFSAPKVGTTATLSWARHRTPILLAIMLAMFNQFTGINAILYYLNDIFAAAGFTKVSGDLQTIAVGGVNLIATLAGMALIDRFGRRTLLIWGAIGCAIALSGVAVIMATDRGQMYLLYLLLLFITSFAMSQGAVIWVYMSEIFPTQVRASGQSLGSATHWIVNAIISGLFPLVALHTKALPFVFFAVCTVIQAICIWKRFPETKGMALEDIDASIT